MEAQHDSIPRYQARESMLRREGVVVAAGLLALLGATTGAWYWVAYRDMPERIVEQFIDAEQNARTAEARACLTPGGAADALLAVMADYRRRNGTSLLRGAQLMGGSMPNASGATVNLGVWNNAPASVTPPGNAWIGRTFLPMSLELRRDKAGWRVDAEKTLHALRGQLAGYGLQLPAIRSPRATRRSPLRSQAAVRPLTVRR